MTEGNRERERERERERAENSHCRNIFHKFINADKAPSFSHVPQPRTKEHTLGD